MNPIIFFDTFYWYFRGRYGSVIGSVITVQLPRKESTTTVVAVSSNLTYAGILLVSKSGGLAAIWGDWWVSPGQCPVSSPLNAGRLRISEIFTY